MAMAKFPLFITALLTACLLSCSSAVNAPRRIGLGNLRPSRSSAEFVGGVYAMSNDIDENTIVTYARRPNGTLQLIDAGVKTGGKGAVVNFLPDSDTLFSSFALVITSDNRFVLAVNAGSNSVSVLRVQPDFSLRLVHVQPVLGFGPISVAVSGRMVYVVSVDGDGEFDSPMAQEGVLSGFILLGNGKLVPIPRSGRNLTFRPGGIQFSPDGRSLVVSSLSSSVNALEKGKVEEMFVFSVNSRFLLSAEPVSIVTSTELNNAEGRNLPAVIGFEIVRSRGVQYLVVPEVRFLAGPDGMAGLDQAGSVSTWRLDSQSRLFPVQLDVPVGPSVASGQLAPCWVEFSADLKHYWVSNTLSDSVSVFSFDKGISTLEEEVGATGPSPVDLWRSRDSKFLYQLFEGSVGAFEIGEGGSLTEIQNPMNVPDFNTQGIVAF
ncbi:Nitrous oxide reductase [Gracilaria domingensis]|nr:Nitrous oxide reductase [Gracilaria domingensis]